MDGVPLLQDIEHPQGVDGQYLDGPVGLGVEGGGGVGGDGGNVHILVGQGGLNLGVVGGDSDIIHYICFAVWGHGNAGFFKVFLSIFSIRHQLGRAHAGGAGEDHNLGQSEAVGAVGGQAGIFRTGALRLAGAG